MLLTAFLVLAVVPVAAVVLLIALLFAIDAPQWVPAAIALVLAAAAAGLVGQRRHSRVVGVACAAGAVAVALGLLYLLLLGLIEAVEGPGPS